MKTFSVFSQKGCLIVLVQLHTMLDWDNTSNTCNLKGSERTKNVIKKDFYFAKAFSTQAFIRAKRLQVYMGSFKYKQGQNSNLQTTK